MVDSKFDVPGFLKPLEKILPRSLYEVVPSFFAISILGIVFVFFNAWYRKLTEIDPFSLNESVLALEPTQYFRGSILLLIPIIFFVGIFIWRRKLLFIEWSVFEGGQVLRLLIGICICLISWAHITYPFNYFLEESFFLERSLVFVLTALVIWRPIFIILYLVIPILIHFGEPVLINNWSVTELPSRVLVLFSVQLLLWLVYKKSRWRIAPFMFLLLCIICSNYFPAGFAKLKLGWLANDQVYLLLPNMYADGWLSFLSQETLSEITRFAAKNNLLLKIGTLIVEVGCILILSFKLKSIRFFLIGFTVFHVLVFIMTGICFWPWVIFELTLFYILWKKETFKAIIKRFTIWHFILSAFLIVTSNIWLKPSVYVWYDSPLNYSYTFEVEDDLGNTSNLPSQFFWPKYYEFAFTNGFHFLHENETVDVTWGVSLNQSLVDELLKSKTDEEILLLEKKYGESRFNPKLSKEFERYITEFINERKYELTMNPWFRAISAPTQRVMYPATNEFTYDGGYEISKINVYQKLSFFDGENYREIRNREVLTILIPAKED